jgi:hypothetical protein
MCGAFASVWPDPSKALRPVNLGLWLSIAVVVLCGCTSQKDVDLVDAALSGDLPKVQALLKQGADIEATAFDGLTPLDAAAKEGHLEVLKYLIDNGATVNGVGHSNRTALGDAAIYEHTDCVRYLISKGGEIRSTAEWRQGLLDRIRKDNKPELYDLVKEVNDRERGGT